MYYCNELTHDLPIQSYPILPEKCSEGMSAFISVILEKSLSVTASRVQTLVVCATKRNTCLNLKRKNTHSTHILHLII